MRQGGTAESAVSSPAVSGEIGVRRDFSGVSGLARVLLMESAEATPRPNQPDRRMLSMTPKTLRIALVTAMALGLAAPATALACGGKDGKGKGAHFQRKDTNQDGFLTEAEVGAERWQRIKVADSN